MSNNRRILFITLSNIGDLVMTTPLLEALHIGYPEHLIDVVGDARSSQLLRACPYLGRLLHKDKRGGFGAHVALIGSLREHVYDVAVDLRTAFLTMLVRCGQRGIKRRGTSSGTHAVLHHFTALRPILGPDASVPAQKIWLDQQSRTRARQLLGDTSAAATLVVAPGANWPGKIWPVDHYIAAVNLLADDFTRVIVLGGPDDKGIGAEFAAGVRLPVVNLTGETGLLDAAACLEGARAFIGNDSGLGHVAAALGVPSLTVFGPGDPDRYRPWGDAATLVKAPGADLARLQPAVVAAALRDHLNNRSTPA